MPSAARAQALLFLLVLGLGAWQLDTGRNDNTVSRALAVRALVETGALEITEHHALTGDKAVTDGRYYSDKAPLPTLAVALIWKALRATGLVEPCADPVDDRVLVLGGLLFGSVPFALLVLLVHRRLLRCRVPHPALLAALPFLGSFLFVYSGTFYNHLPAALFALLAAIDLTEARRTRAGLWAGLAVACDASMLFPLAVWIAQVALGRKGLVGFALGLLPGALITAGHNLAVTGSPLTFPSAHVVNYGIMREAYGFGTWQPRAFLGLTISPYRGLLVYAPAMVAVLLWAWGRRARIRSGGLLADPFLLPAAVLMLAFFTHGTWWGGWTYGPRYLTAVPALLLYRGLPGIAADQRMARIAIALSLAGLACAAAARLTTGYALPTTVADPLVESILPLVLSRTFAPAGWPAAAGFSPVMGAFLYALTLAAALRGMQRLSPA